MIYSPRKAVKLSSKDRLPGACRMPIRYITEFNESFQSVCIYVCVCVCFFTSILLISLSESFSLSIFTIYNFNNFNTSIYMYVGRYLLLCDSNFCDRRNDYLSKHALSSYCLYFMFLCKSYQRHGNVQSCCARKCSRFIVLTI